MNKFLFLLLPALFAFGTIAFADTKELPTEALGLATALMRPEIQNKVQEFNSEATLQDIKVSTTQDSTVYELDGVILKGGDVPCGSAILTIKQVRISAPFGPGSKKVYSAEVQIENQCTN